MGRISPAESLIFDIDRGGNSIYIEGSGIEMHRSRSMGWSPYIAPVVGGFSSRSPAEQDGIKLEIKSPKLMEWSFETGAIFPLLFKKS